MKQFINSAMMHKLFVVLILAAVAKALSLAVSFFLPHEGVSVASYQERDIYSNYRPSTMLNIVKKKAVKKTEPVYALKNLILKGLYADTDSPFIAVEDAKKVTLVSIGEQFKGYKLKEVHSDRAVFEKSGKNYELKFKEEKFKNASIKEIEPEIVTDGGAVFIKRNELKKYSKNPNAIFKSIKIKEIIENKRLKGFRVLRVDKKSVFGQLGLQKNDIITGANNREFKSVSQVFKLYNNMDKLDSLKLHVKRGNEEKELEYEIYE
ncbi:MAG: PDZ domain-containing protein [Campylobacterota bacterium]|nr:PDZ domain-containing protein [Campylobacterota bacterium]